jgi:hypothetical protein
MLFQKRVMRITFDIYVLIVVFSSFNNNYII